MKLSLHQLSPQLAKNLSPIYIVSGDEHLLVQEAVDLIRETANQAGFSECIRIAVESGTNWGEAFYANTQTLSLFSTQRIIELDLSLAKLNATSSKILQDYISQPAADTILIIRTNKLDAKTEQSNWYKTLDKASVIITIWPITIEQLPNWILQRAKKLNLTITQSAATLLAALVEGNLLAAAQEIEKLRLLQTTDIIDDATIESAVADHAHFDIFTLVDSSLAGNAKRSLRILDNLAAEDSEPTLVLWALVRELRSMASIAEHVQQGAALSSLFSKFRIWEKRQANVRAFLQRHTQKSCMELLIDAAHTDRMIKGAEIGNVWQTLKQLVMKINLSSTQKVF